MCVCVFLGKERGGFAVFPLKKACKPGQVSVLCHTPSTTSSHHTYSRRPTNRLGIQKHVDDHPRPLLNPALSPSVLDQAAMAYAYPSSDQNASSSSFGDGRRTSRSNSDGAFDVLAEIKVSPALLGMRNMKTHAGWAGQDPGRRGLHRFLPGAVRGDYGMGTSG